MESESALPEMMDVDGVGSRGPKRCSPIWTYFKVQITDGVVACVCSVNGCRYSNKGKNVTTLKNHLKTRHPTEFELCFKDKRAARPIPSGIAESLGNEASTNSSDKVEPYSRDSDEFKRLKLKVTIFAACTSFPLTLVNCPEFKGVIEACDVRAAKCLPCPNTLKSWVLVYYEERKLLVREYLMEAAKVVISADLWTQKGFIYGYLGVTARFFNKKSSRMDTVALAVRHLPSPHTAPRIQALASDILSEWGLSDDSVFRYVTDLGANIVCALKIYQYIQVIPLSTDNEAEGMKY
jgi:hypothetical protein